MRRVGAWWLGAFVLATAGGARGDEPARPYREVVAATAGMVSDPEARALAARYGLDVLNVTWEDTGRSKGSSVGPNISDMTIQVAEADPRTGGYRLTCMPVIRFPNFEDRSADLAIDRFQVLVGNERGQPLRPVSLRELLANLRHYLTDPLSWEGARTSLLAERDTHVLVSAQACFLPVPAEGTAEFNPVLFNYQSRAGDPAVLTILVTREGASVTVIDNVRDAFGAGQAWGQRLFFNHHGQRASLTGQRVSSFVQGGGQVTPTPIALGSEAQGPAGGLNQVLLIQVPLKQKAPPPAAASEGALLACPAPGCVETARAASDVEEAVIGHGAVEGPFTELAGLAIERDERFPIRVTVQFYKATSNGVVNAADLETIAGQIAQVYADADAVGSLVTQGETGRATEHQAPPVEYPAWWDAFWARHELNTGQRRAEAVEMLRALTGEGWVPPSEPALRDALERAMLLEPSGAEDSLRREEGHGLLVCGTENPPGNQTPSDGGRRGLALTALGLVALGLVAGALRRLA